MTTAERLAASTAPGANGCLLWTRATFGSAGYGAVWHDGRTQGAHRVAYELANGPIPTSMLVRHKCDVRRCVNPEHLELGTYADNAQDCVARDRKATGEYSANARLSDADVAEIRETYASGAWTQRALARRYGVTQARVWQVVRLRARTSPSRPGLTLAGREVA